MNTSIFWSAVMGGFFIGAGLVITLCPFILGVIK